VWESEETRAAAAHYLDQLSRDRRQRPD
jgi:hypothetical protein